MKYKDAVKECARLGACAMEQAQTADLASRTYGATMELYNVAAAAGDELAMQTHRDTLHACVDTILDSGAMVARSQREIQRVANSVTEFPQT